MKELLEKILGQIKKTPSGVRAYEDLYHICLETQKTDIPLSVEYLKKLSDIIENGRASGGAWCDSEVAVCYRDPSCRCEQVPSFR